MDYQTLCKQLEAKVHQEIPISRFMGVRIVDFAVTQLVLEADLAPNINVHDTAFAGSLYSICALSGWCLVTLQHEIRSVEAEVVVAKGEIKYIKPVTSQPIIACAVLQDNPDEVFADYQERGKARITVETIIQEQGESAAIFSGNYALIS